MMNLLKRFKSLITGPAPEIVTITANHGNGTSRAVTLSGAVITVKGESVAAGNKAYVEGNQVVRQVPNLIAVDIEV